VLLGATDVTIYEVCMARLDRGIHLQVRPASAPILVKPTQPEIEKVTNAVARTPNQLNGLCCLGGPAATL
jgi:hypothetical protein